MSEIKYIRSERCKNCKYRRKKPYLDVFEVYGCYCKPYKGKRITDIKICPREEDQHDKS